MQLSHSRNNELESRSKSFHQISRIYNLSWAESTCRSRANWLWPGSRWPFHRKYRGKDIKLGSHSFSKRLLEPGPTCQGDTVKAWWNKTQINGAPLWRQRRRSNAKERTKRRVYLFAELGVYKFQHSGLSKLYNYTSLASWSQYVLKVGSSLVNLFIALLSFPESSRPSTLSDIETTGSGTWIDSFKKKFVNLVGQTNRSRCRKSNTYIDYTHMQHLQYDTLQAKRFNNSANHDIVSFQKCVDWESVDVYHGQF